ncbi:DUF2207 domain-containing protein [Cyanobium gracile]|uniref:Putative membrane protein (DUF2207) n=1 Tax=Cyanobium gracile (strain ATCC 27147 / PCC 6307) TaxID=292564 RepID=K9P8B3_CYAGP|nr:DUF2207 domain-containing protein [Cyanobium gracile]AFY29657.1 putative membrane protein (DUF2207) [Cyanobium gracile PCC 6307]
MAEGPTAARRRLRSWRWGLGGLLGLALTLLLLAPWGAGATLSAAERQLTLTDFQMQAVVEPTGAVQVSETLTARFDGSWNGLVRQIPLLARRPGGLEPLGLRVLAVTDPEGRPYRYESSHPGADLKLKIWIPGAENTSRTAVISYRLKRGLRFYPDHDEFNWNVTGNAWEVPIERASARVQLPPAVSGLHASVYTGPSGARGHDATLTIGADAVASSTTRRLEPGEGFTLAVGFAKGLVPLPSALAQWIDWWLARLSLLLPLLCTGVLGPLWWRIGRDPALGAVPVAYEPPEGLPPAVLGSLVAEQVSGSALSATLVALAVKGQLRIEQDQQKLLFLNLGKRYVFTLLGEPAQRSALLPHEAYLLETLFPSAEPGATVSTQELREHYYVHVPGFEHRVMQAVLAETFFRRWPETVRVLTFFGGLGLAAGVVVLAAALLPHDIVMLQGVAHPVVILVSLALTVVLVGVFAWIMPSRTTRGTAVLRQTLGFQEFLRRVEVPRLERLVLTPELFERYLPYAMVAGLTRQWTSAFQGILQEPPSWYVGDGIDFDANDFGTSLEDCFSTTTGAMQSSPSSSSSSSGSSGGGSSGGGDGGGGGGGF